ncbi:MAG: hypothetical protein OXI94_08320 [Gemmatimonadota bacterium]|nr:hypothetical protein [Gemmatimonadota bacterium]
MVRIEHLAVAQKYPLLPFEDLIQTCYPHLSVETVRVVERLPEPFQPEQMDLSLKG